MTPLLGLICFLLNRWANGVFSLATALTNAANIGVVAQISSAYAFTTVGFLATVATILLGLSERTFFLRYRHKGHLVTFLIGYFLTMVTMFVIFCGSFVVLAKPEFINWLVSAMEVSLIQLVFLSVVLCNVVRNSAT